jgi:hypothetical protein
MEPVVRKGERMSSTRISRQALRNRLRRLRKRAGHSHYSVGQQLGLPPSSTVLWERGHAPIERADIERLLDLYQAGPVDRDDVLRLVDRPVDPGVFISYRRQDSAGISGRIYDRFVDHFVPEQVFRDIESIRPGVDFIDELESVLDTCTVMLVVIGRGWLETLDDAGSRLDDPADMVRREVSRGLERNVFVIPVLVDGAEVPRAEQLPAALAELPRRNGRHVTNEGFDADCRALLAFVEDVIVPR